MIKRIAFVTFLLCLSVSLVSVSAWAMTYDFRTSQYSGAYNQPSFDPATDPLTLTALPTGSKLYWDSTDGFGVLGDENDEVDDCEWLLVTFDNLTNVTNVYITDLFYEGNPAYKEKGWYQIYDGSTWGAQVWFEALTSQTPSPATNGELTLAVNQTVKNIVFGVERNQNKSEFSVAGLDVSPVPIPGAVWLLGSGILGLAGLRRKLSK